MIKLSSFFPQSKGRILNQEFLIRNMQWFQNIIRKLFLRLNLILLKVGKRLKREERRETWLGRFQQGEFRLVTMTLQLLFHRVGS